MGQNAKRQSRRGRRELRDKMAADKYNTIILSTRQPPTPPPLTPIPFTPTCPSTMNSDGTRGGGGIEGGGIIMNMMT